MEILLLIKGNNSVTNFWNFAINNINYWAKIFTKSMAFTLPFLNEFASKTLGAHPHMLTNFRDPTSYTFGAM